MTSTDISLTVTASAPGTTLTIFLDDRAMEVISVEPTEHVCCYAMADDDGEHKLEIVLSGKIAQHTRVDDQGQIVEDLLVQVKDLSFDGIRIDQLCYDLAEYHHDFNGTGQQHTEKFFGTMGCNGRVEMRFRTPIYLWLLENM